MKESREMGGEELEGGEGQRSRTKLPDVLSLVHFAISIYGQLGPSALPNLKDRAQKHRTYFPVRWYMSAIACTAIRGSAFVRDAWLKAFSKGLCAHASSFLRGASAETAEQWHSDEVGDGIVEPSQPCSVRV